MNSVLLIFFGLMVIVPVIYLLFTKDVIRAAFAFVTTMLGIAALYVLLNAEVAAVVQLLIYAGGVIVLLIFGIMLTKRSGNEGISTLHRNVWVANLVVLVAFGLLAKWILTSELMVEQGIANTQNQVNQIGVLFLTDHIIAFEIVAVLLLVALVGAAFLAKKSSSHD